MSQDSTDAMSSMLEPSFLLELGAYAVAAAGIRLLKNRVSRGRHQAAQAPLVEADLVSPCMAIYR